LKGWYEWFVSRETAACIVYPATITAWAVLGAWGVQELRPGALGFRLPVLAVVLFIGAALIAEFMLHWSFYKIRDYIEDTKQAQTNANPAVVTIYWCVARLEPNRERLAIHCLTT
jgi:ABC-type Na+ efflux pump permease subunit